MDTCRVFTQVLNTIDGAIADQGKSIVNGFEMTSFNTQTKVDEKYHRLTKPSDTDAETREILCQMLTATKQVMEKQLEEYLPDGKYHDPSDALKEQARSCASNNISGKQVFGLWKSKSAQAQTASVTKICQKTQFKANKVREKFLLTNSDEEKKAIFKKATAEGRKDRQKEKLRQ